MHVWASALFIVVCLLSVSVWGQIQETISIHTAQGGVYTRLGCTTTLLCMGIGEDIFWTSFSFSSGHIQNISGELYIEVTSNPDTGFLRSGLTLVDVDDSDVSFYTCTVLGEDGSSETVTVLLTVDGPIAITPTINNVDLSTYHTGQTLTVGCPVSTCSTSYTLQFLSESGEVIKQQIVEGVNNPVIVSLTLTVTEDITGMYQCYVEGTLPNGELHVATQDFNITGVPLPPLTTPPPTVSTSTTSTIATSKAAALTSFSLSGLLLLLGLLQQLLRL